MKRQLWIMPGPKLRCKSIAESSNKGITTSSNTGHRYEQGRYERSSWPYY